MDGIAIKLSDLTSEAAHQNWITEYWPWWGDERAFEATMPPDQRFIHGSDTCTFAELICCLVYNGTERCQIVAFSILQQLEPWLDQAGII